MPGLAWWLLWAWSDSDWAQYFHASARFGLYAWRQSLLLWWAVVDTRSLYAELLIVGCRTWLGWGRGCELRWGGQYIVVIIYFRKKIVFEDNVILFLYPYRFRQASGLHKYRNIILYRVIWRSLSCEINPYHAGHIIKSMRHYQFH